MTVLEEISKLAPLLTTIVSTKYLRLPQKIKCYDVRAKRQRISISTTVLVRFSSSARLIFDEICRFSRALTSSIFRPLNHGHHYRVRSVHENRFQTRPPLEGPEFPETDVQTLGRHLPRTVRGKPTPHERRQKVGLANGPAVERPGHRTDRRE